MRGLGKFTFALSFILGIFMAGYLNYHSGLIIFACLFLLVFPLLVGRYAYSALAVLFVAGVFCQSYYQSTKYEAAKNFRDTVIAANDGGLTYWVTGTVTGEVRLYPESTYFYVNLDGGLKARVVLDERKNLYPGQTVEMTKPEIYAVNIHNRLSVNNTKHLGNNAFLSIRASPENFNVTGFNNYYLTQYYGKILREKNLNLMEKHLDGDKAIVCAAMFSGETLEIPPKLYDNLIITGTIHIIVVSGSHFVMIFGIVFGFWSFFLKSRRLRLFLTLPFLIFFTFFTGASVTVLRSFVIIGLVLFADLFYLPHANAKVAAVACGAVFLFLTPTLAYNVSFLLSFGAAFGLAMFVSPRFSEKKKAKGTGLLRKAVNFSRDYLKEFFGTFYGAQIFSLPLIYYFFARVSNIAVVSNLLEIPVISAILTMSIIFTVLAPLGYWMGSLISFPLDILLSYFIGVINFTAEYNGGNLINAPFSFLALFGVTSALTAVYYALSFRRKLFRGMAAASALIFVLLSASTVVYPYDSGKMYVTFVGYNDTSSAVITTGTGENIFVGALNELLYWSSNTPIKLNTVNPLIIVTDVGDPADLKEISDAYRIKNIVTPAAYKYALTFMPNVTFIEGNVNTVYKDVEISLVSDGTNIYEAVFGYKGTELSFSSDGQYVLENILSGESAKYAVINYAGSSRDRNEKDHGFTENIEKIKNSENFDKSLVLFSKKYYNDYIKRYDNFSILEFDENGVRSLE